MSLRDQYQLDNAEYCDAKKYGLYYGKDFDEWFLEEYLPYFEKNLFEE